ncbi:MAG: hypothetical protein QM724_13375 [Flavobacteriales bacterium]
MLSQITLREDHHSRADTVKMDVRVLLEVQAVCNPDHGHYRRRADYDSLFIVQLSIGARPDGRGSPMLDGLLDLKDADQVRFKNAHAFSCEIKEIWVDRGDGERLEEDLPGGVHLELGTRWALRSSIDVEMADMVLEERAITCPQGEEDIPVELEIGWSTIIGATEYQLEWAYVDDYPPVLGAPPLLANSLTYDLRRDATRVSLNHDQLSFRIPLIYDRGYIVYRARAVGEQDALDPNPGSPVYGPWTTTAPVGSVPAIDRFRIEHAHEPLKNWQVTSSFAEDGRHKEVMTYADGSLRSRQVVTRNSSLDVPLVGETFYDMVGRPAVEALPVPMIKDRGCEGTDGPFAPITYYPGFNVNMDGDPYGADDIGPDEAGCGLKAVPMSDANGAELYYSSAQLSLPGRLIPTYSFLPKANGYPFAQTEYTRDNTGRIRRKGGVGEELSLGSSFETRFMYTAPAQSELDRLFGSEAGYASHYQKHVTIDPNRQASITYLDRAGRIVATALAGNVDESTEALPSAPSAAVATTTVMLGGNTPSARHPSNRFDPDLQGWVYEDALSVLEDGEYTFSYTAAPPVSGYIPDCPGDLCYNCVYKLTLRVVDACGNVRGEIGPVLGTLDRLLQTAPALNVLLDEGEYTVHKELVVSEEHRTTFLQDYRSQLDECDIPTLEVLRDQYLQGSISDCNITCTKCREDLGSMENFLREGRGTQSEYQALAKACDALCPSNSWCEIGYNNMLEDLSPGGQYATYYRSGGAITATEWTSIFKANSNTFLQNKLYDNSTSSWGTFAPNVPLWRQPSLLQNGVEQPIYLEDDGTRTEDPLVRGGWWI